MLSELPEPPIPLSEIGPIPPPPMFSSPSPTLLARQRQIPLSDCEDEGKCNETLMPRKRGVLEQLIGAINHMTEPLRRLLKSPLLAQF